MAFHHTGNILFRNRVYRGHSVSANLAFLILFLCLGAGRVNGQSYVTLSAGTAVPLGNFAMQDYPEGGFALAGASISADGAWFIDRSWGFGARVSYFSNPVEVGELANERMREDPFFLSLVIRSDPYRIFYAAPGVYYRVLIRKGFEAVFNAKGGMAYAISPYQLYKAEYFLIGRNWTDITSAKSWSWMAGAEGQVSWDLSGCIALSASVGAVYIPVEWRFLRSDGTYRYQAHDVIMLSGELGIKVKIGLKDE